MEYIGNNVTFEIWLSEPNKYRVHQFDHGTARSRAGTEFVDLKAIELHSDKVLLTDGVHFIVFHSYPFLEIEICSWDKGIQVIKFCTELKTHFEVYPYGHTIKHYPLTIYRYDAFDHPAKRLYTYAQNENYHFEDIQITPWMNHTDLREECKENNMKKAIWEIFIDRKNQNKFVESENSYSFLCDFPVYYGVSYFPDGTSTPLNIALSYDNVLTITDGTDTMILEYVDTNIKFHQWDQAILELVIRNLSHGYFFVHIEGCNSMFWEDNPGYLSRTEFYRNQIK